MGSPRNRFDSIPLVAVAPREGREVIYATHNLCDQTTWHTESERVTDAVLSEAGGVWSSGDTHWIDMIHGKVFDERALIADQMADNPGSPHGYGVVVKVNGVEKTMREPFVASGGDYTVNYAAGTVTPISGTWTGVVTASYSKKSGPGWILQPTPSSGEGDPGRALIIEKAEIQFSDDIAMSSAVKMEVYGLADFFAPQLLTTNGGPLPPGTPIPIEETVYDSIDQMIDEAVGMYPIIPTLSAGTNRGYARPRYIFQFHYATARPLFSSLGMFLRISVTTPFGGERATATFYAVSARDVGVEKAIEILTTVQ